MMPTPDQQQPTAGAQPQMAEDQGGGTTVCIAKQADGTFSVYKEGVETPAGGEGGEEGGEMAGAKTCKSIEEALTAAREMLTGDDGGMSVEQAFQSGFKGDQMPMGGGY